jgi:hypothetical protein
MAGIARQAGHEVYVVDHQAAPRAPLPPCVEAVVSVLSLPTLREDCEASAALAQRYPGCARYIYTSIRQTEVWRVAFAHSRSAMLLLPESISAIASIFGSGVGLGLLREGETPAQEVATAIPELSDLEPLPARDLLDHSPYVFSPFSGTAAAVAPIATAQGSFGCPHPCGYYCPYPAAEGRRFRAFSAARMFREYEQMASLGVAGVVYRDPVFTFRASRTFELCGLMLAAGRPVPWWCETRIDTLTPKLLQAMAGAGCVGLEIGVESGDDSVLQGVARKHLTRQRVREFHQVAKDVGIVPHFLFMMGIPGESKENIRRTIEFILELELPSDSFNLSTITAYPGTPLYADARQQGWIEEDWSRHTSYTVTMRTDLLSTADLEEAEVFGHELHLLLAQRPSLAPGEWPQLDQAYRERVRAWAEPAMPVAGGGAS